MDCAESFIENPYFNTSVLHLYLNGSIKLEHLPVSDI